MAPHKFSPFPAIVGGTSVQVGTYPFYGVSTAVEFCGCSLIHPDILLTAAHCSPAFPVGQTINLGGSKLDGSDSPSILTVAEVLTHPLFSLDATYDYDFMLLKTFENISDVVTPEWNSDGNVPSTNDVCLALGFGSTSFNGDVSSDLLKVQVSTVDQAECVEAIDTFAPGEGSEVTDQMICAGGEFGRDICFGDSGSPLLFDGKIVGLVSWGVGCGNGETPNMYARVSEADLWIKEGICQLTEVFEPEFCANFTDSPTLSPTVTPTLSPTVAPPPLENDNCTDAIALTTGSTFGSTLSASFDNVGFCGTINSGPGVWYTLVGDGSSFQIDTCGDTTFDTRITVFSGGCESLDCVTGNDQAINCDVSGGSRVTFSTEEGIPYFVLVHGNFDFTGRFELNVDTIKPPPNDICEDAITVEPGEIVDGNMENGGVDSSFPSFPFCSGRIRAPGVWYKVVGTGGELVASTCDLSVIDTILTVFDSCNTTVATCIVDNDDARFCGLQSRVQWETEFGVEYYVLVHAYASAEVGPFGLEISAVETPAPVVAPTDAPVVAPTEAPAVVACDPDDLKNECSYTSQCKELYETAIDCSNADGGICLCTDLVVCGCL